MRAAGVAATSDAGDALPSGVRAAKLAVAAAAPEEVRLRFVPSIGNIGEPSSCDSCDSYKEGRVPLSMRLCFCNLRSAVSPAPLDALHSSLPQVLLLSLSLSLLLSLQSVSSRTMKPLRLSESEFDVELDSRHLGTRVKDDPITGGHRIEFATRVSSHGCDGSGSFATGTERRSLRRHAGASAACF